MIRFPIRFRVYAMEARKMRRVGRMFVMLWDSYLSAFSSRLG